MLLLTVALAGLLQTLPLVVKLGIDVVTPAPMGYTVSLDGGTPIDVGKPATNPACKDFVGSATGACIPFTVTVTTVGTHTVSVVGYNLGGVSAPIALTFEVTAPPGNGGNLRLVK